MALGELRDVAALFEREPARTCARSTRRRRPPQEQKGGRPEGERGDAPSEPCRSLKPLTGTRLVPVVNWSRRAFFSRSHVPTTCIEGISCVRTRARESVKERESGRTCQNQRTSWSSLWKPR